LRTLFLGGSPSTLPIPEEDISRSLIQLFGQLSLRGGASAAGCSGKRNGLVELRPGVFNDQLTQSKQLENGNSMKKMRRGN